MFSFRAGLSLASQRKCHGLEQAYTDFKNAADLGLSRWENDNPPTRPGELFGKERSFEGYGWALAGGELLCAQFCDLDVALANDNKLNQLRHELLSRVERNPDKLAGPYTEIKALFTPNLFEVNLARILFSRHFDTVAIDAIVPSEMAAEPAPFFAWDAHTNQLDFTHQRRGVPTDQKRILHVFSFYPKWHNDGLDASERSRVIDACWNELKRMAAE